MKRFLYFFFFLCFAIAMQKILPETIYAFVGAVGIIVTICLMFAPTEAEKAEHALQAKNQAENDLIQKYRHQKDLQEAKVFFG